MQHNQPSEAADTLGIYGARYRPQPGITPGFVHPKVQASAPTPIKQHVQVIDDSESSGEYLTLADIRHGKVRTKDVREFMRAQIASVKSEEEELFQ